MSTSDLMLFLLLDDTATLVAVVLLATYLRGPVSPTPGQTEPPK